MKRDTKIKAKAGKDKDVSTKVKPMKAPQRTTRQASGMRASMNGGGKRRTKG